MKTFRSGSFPNKIMFLIGCILPLSAEFDAGIAKTNLPIEPILAILGIIIPFSLWKKSNFNEILPSKITVIIFLYAAWLFITSLTSTMPVLSAKYLTINILHLLVFYLGLFWVGFRQKSIPIFFIQGYCWGLFLVLTFFWVNFYLHDFESNKIVILAQPFFSDNTILSAVLCMMIPWIFVFKFETKYSTVIISLAAIILLITIMALNCRAAWISLLLAAFLMILIKYLGLHFKGFIFLCLAFIFAGLAIFVYAKNSVQEGYVERVKSGNKWETFRSITNLNSDVSNLERINRYKCALRMFKAKPILGFGPGTYQYAYLPFQKEEEMTRISQRKDYTIYDEKPQNGRGGGAHSEYLQALSEAGFIGLLTWLMLVFTTYYLAFKVYSKCSPTDRKYVLAALFGLTTYFAHGLFNNFLHNEEVSSLFWTMVALIVWLEHRSNQLSINTR